MVKLDGSRIAWIIRMKEQGVKNAEIASVQKISIRRIQQIYAQYRKGKNVPSLKRAGRPKKDVTEFEMGIVRKAYERFRSNALYLEVIISRIYNLKINHNRIHAIMVSEGMSVEEYRKHTRKKWIRYERDYSNSLWHTDWHEIKDSRWKGKQLIAYEDDASRYIVGYGVFDSASSENSTSVLGECVRKYGKPASILTDNGSPFTTNPDTIQNAPTIFEHYLMKHKIKHVLSRVHHPQTNGKVEKFFDIFERKVKFFSSIDEFMEWYNTVRPHGALNLQEMETPVEAYYRRMPPKGVLIDPAVLWGEMIS
jgi:putative transposase